MTTRKDVRVALASAVQTGAGVRAIGWIPDSIPAPCATVGFREMDPRMVLSGAKSTYQMLVRLWAPRNETRTAQDLLDDWCEPSGSLSVIEAIETGANWSQTIDYAQVTSIGELREQVRADDVYLTVDLEVEVVW